MPYPAGGPTDTIARILSERMQSALGQPVIIENVSGAGGAIGVGRVAHAAPDGYTVSIGHVQTHVFNPAIMKLDYDVVNDFAPVSLIADTPIWIIAGKTLPADDLKGLIAWLKAQNGKATMGTVGVGGPTDVAGRIFAKETGTPFQIVPYRGGAPLAEDLLGGHIDFDVGQAASTLTYVQSGELKAYAVLQPKRWWAAPNVPTLDELGIHDIDASFWHGIWVPKARRRKRSPSSTPPFARRWPIPACRSGLKRSARKSGRSKIRRPRRWRRNKSGNRPLDAYHQRDHAGAITRQRGVKKEGHERTTSRV